MTNSVKYYKAGEFVIPVYVIGSKPVYGRVDLLITPVDGAGEKWVNSHKVTDTKEN